MIGRNHKTADSLLTAMHDRGHPITFPINVDKIISLLGVSVAVDFMPSAEESIRLSLAGKSSIRINVAKLQKESERRYAVAHTIGHICLHYGSRYDFYENNNTLSGFNGNQDSYEKEANHFAHQLLMPEYFVHALSCDAIKKLKTQNISNGNVAKKINALIADYFYVPDRHAIDRLTTLKIT